MSAPRKKSPKQLSFALHGVRRGRAAREYGGEDHGVKYRRHVTRPFDPTRSLHVTMRAQEACGDRSMLHPRRTKLIKTIVFRAGQRHGVEVRKFVNVGNHLHLHIRTKSRRLPLARPNLRAFLREVGGLIARVMTGAKKGQPAHTSLGSAQGCPSLKRRFWDNLVWSRIIGSWSELKTLARYFRKNERDAAHVVVEQGWPEKCLDFGMP